MIMFWNRKEVLITFSIQVFNQACNVLAANNIKYVYRIFKPNAESNLSFQRSSRWGFSGERADASCQYYIYVHETDYEQADFLISKNVSMQN